MTVDLDRESDGNKITNYSERELNILGNQKFKVIY